VPSTVIRNFRYLPEVGLEITFVGGRCYRYPAVPETVYRQMRASFAKGEFFNVHIRGHFDYVRVTDVE
jgi:hypothetical protein